MTNAKHTIKLDDWQKEILEDEEHHILLAKGRRVGATHLFGIKAVEWLMTHHNPHPTSQIVCASITEDQAQLIIAFAHDHALKKYKKYIGKGRDKPTLNRLILKVDGNRRILLAKPVGNTGASVRGFEGQVLMVDEGSFQPERFWDAAKPVLATTGGRIWTWGTFDGQEGYFWKNYEKAVIKKDPKARFKVWEKNTEEVLAERPLSESWTEEQREGLRKHLEEERNDMSEMIYAQEYLGLAAVERRQFYSDDWIEKVCVLDRNDPITKEGHNYGGFDLARMGGDSFTAEILKRLGPKNIIQVDHYDKKMLSTVENENLVIEFTRKWDCVKSGIDAGSGTLGVSVFDHLIDVDYMKRRVVAINNRKMIMGKSTFNNKNPPRQRLLIQDLHDNLRSMGERGEIRLFNDPAVKASLRSVRWDLKEGDSGLTKVKISGKNTHIAEGLVRAAILAKEKHIKIMIDSFAI